MNKKLTAAMECNLKGYDRKQSAEQFCGIDWKMIHESALRNHALYQASWNGEKPERPVIIGQPSVQHFICQQDDAGKWRLVYRNALEAQLKRIQTDLAAGLIVLPMVLCDFNTLALSSMFTPDLISSEDGSDAFVKPLFNDRRNLERMEKPDLNQGLIPVLLEETRRLRSILPEFIAVGVRLNTGPLSLAAELRGATELIYDMIEAPALCRHFISMLTDLYIEVRDAIHTAAGIVLRPGIVRPDVSFHAPTSGVMICDDTLQVLGPKQFAEFGVPCFERILTHYGGGSIHSCGDTSHLWPDLAALPLLAGIEFGEGNRVNWTAARKAFPEKRLIFWDLNQEGSDYMKRTFVAAGEPRTFVYTQNGEHIKAWQKMIKNS